jgi:hypothetical protein
MLHFLASLALLIFVGERLWHYWREWRWRVGQRRYVQWLKDGMAGAPWSPPPKMPYSEL